ncbi:asparagine synthase-related protein [Dethiobacter alkaliphilus]|uniref:asparagine synthase (glutamine-hydrolyzing) n=1 Tax=Dethiobacter alkaliphilus AHT 1 TaxID=555088 RepID=C0GK31_DETAL|nr:asparagine synthase-related protein [Dethiobacter alkaliphilus]EEG76301.1 asparagine synthase [Dethiobacter alkaliphilus AHT 1]
MSGIAAVIGADDKQALETMLEKIQHRGAGQHLIYENGKYRLGEINVTENKVIHTGDDDYGVIFDGMPVYGGKVLTRTKILELYKTEGPGFIKNIAGNFVIIISNTDEFFIARDPYGTKPLYYSKDGKYTLVASEIKSLTPLTDKIEIFPPGHFFTQTKELKRFKDVPVPVAKKQLDTEEAAAELNKLLSGAVEKVLQQNNDVGSFLSGGLDSSAVVAAASKISSNPLPTFAVGLENSSDILNARKVAKFLRTDHYEYLYTADEMMEVLPDVIYHLESFDVELVNSSIANYLVAQLAHRQGIKIALSGEGADELFAGYHHLKKCADERELNEELASLMKGLHNGGLQRVDRMTQAHSLECIMPFMDPKVVEFALGLPAHFKLSESGTEKWILRQAFSTDLPEEVVWRTKEQFGIGTGNEDIMKQMISQKVTDREYKRAKERSSFPFKNKEEYFYYNIFKEFFPAKSAEETVNRWLV